MDKKVLSALVIFALGLLVGWLVIGWGIWPVEYTNAPMKEVRQEDKLIYLNTLADAFQHNPDPTLARERLKLLGGPEAVRSLTLDAIAQAQAKGDMTAVERMLQLTKAVGLNVAARPGQAVEPAQPGQAEDVAAQPAEKSGGLTLLQICGGSLGVLVLLAGIAIAAWLLWGRQQGGEESDLPAPLPVSDPLAPASSASWDSNDDSPEVVWEDDGGPARSQPTAVSAGGAAMAFTATYNLDESRYDESFDIESTKDGSYLGECGMTVSEEVSSDAGMATALEVWLFDKSDIRTVTKVLMSDYAFGNQALRDKLSAKGDAVLARQGESFVLDAQTLRLQGQVVDLEYAEGDDAPPRSMFRAVTVNLWVIPQVE